MDRVEKMLKELVDAGELGGAATLVWCNGTASVATAGRRNLVTNAPVERDTMFRIASMTKPVTVVAALMLYDEGRFDLDDAITSCVPELGHMRVLRNPNGPLDETDEATRAITFRDLLTHRSGLTYAEFHRGPIGRAYADTLGAEIDNPLTPDEWIARVATLPLIDQPGAGFHYGISSDLLGFIVARLDGAPFGDVLARRIFEPLGMRDTGFSVSHEKRNRLAALCGFDEAGHLTTLAAAPGGHALEERPDDMTFESGSGGLFSTVDDYLAFGRVLVGDPGVPALLHFGTRAMMMSNQLTPEQRATTRMFGRPVFAEGHGYGMGVAVVMEPDKADVLQCRGGIGTVGWPGAYGGWWQADPNDGSVLIFLTHNMLELSQMAHGIGLGAWSAIASFHEIATSQVVSEKPALHS